MSNNFPTQSEDQIVGGMYRLGAVVRRSVVGCVYETEFGDDARPAVIKTRHAEPADAERQVAIWEEAIQLNHPNLLPIYAAGRSVMDDGPVCYAVMERADESLAGVLAERALSDAETREMLTPALAALQYLHKNGYAHSRLKTSNILAVGDQLKLSSDGITRVADGGSPAEDMRALGAVLVEALTQRPPTVQGDSEPLVLSGASQTFTDIVRHCLDPDPDKRWTVDQLQARLDGPVAAPVPMRLPEPAARAEEHHEGDEADPERRTPRWVFGALALLVLIVVLAAVVRRNTVPSGVAPVPPRVEQAAPEVRVPEAASASNPRADSAAEGGKPGRRGQGWAVIAAAYVSRDPAEKRSREMARRWSNFKWSVAQQQTGKPLYLVVIGQNLPEDEAEKLRDQAVRSGLPTDTYIKKLQ
jgi:hypothetical protein